MCSCFTELSGRSGEIATELHRTKPARFFAMTAEGGEEWKIEAPHEYTKRHSFEGGNLKILTTKAPRHGENKAVNYEAGHIEALL